MEKEVGTWLDMSVSQSSKLPVCARKGSDWPSQAGRPGVGGSLPCLLSDLGLGPEEGASAWPEDPMVPWTDHAGTTWPAGDRACRSGRSSSEERLREPRKNNFGTTFRGLTPEPPKGALWWRQLALRLFLRTEPHHLVSLFPL